MALSESMVGEDSLLERSQDIVIVNQEFARATAATIEDSAEIEPIKVIGEVDAATAIEAPSSFYFRFVKYPVERVVALLLLAGLMIPMAFIALAIRINMGPNVFFRQDRVGQNGSVFSMWKFRTMDPDRRQRQVDIDGPDRRLTHKSALDPRQRKLGKVLRASSLDEFPQLWDVVKGNMSLIGPRPELESVVRKFDLWHHPRHLIKPGITGLWQVSDLREELLYENLHIDVEYVRTVSLRNDLRILVRTLTMPFKKTGW